MATGGIRKRFSKAFFRRPNVVVNGIENLPATGGAVLAVNHVGFLEPGVVAMMVLNRRKRQGLFLTKQVVYRKYRLVGLTGLLGMVNIPPKRSGDILTDVVRVLQVGEVVVFFPEGIRNPSSRLLKGKTGMIRAAVQAGVPIIPIGYSGPAPRSRFASVVVFLKRTISATVSIGTPIRIPAPPEPMTKEWLDDQTHEVMRAIGTLCNKPYDY